MGPNKDWYRKGATSHHDKWLNWTSQIYCWEIMGLYAGDLVSFTDLLVITVYVPCSDLSVDASLFCYIQAQAIYNNLCIT